MPGFLRASAISSCTVFAGSEGRTTSAWPKFCASKRDVREVLHRVVRRSGVKGGMCGMRCRGEQHGIAVRPASWRHRPCRACHPRRRGSRRSAVWPERGVAWARACEDQVGRPAGRRGHDDTDRLVRVTGQSVAPSAGSITHDSSSAAVTEARLRADGLMAFSSDRDGNGGALPRRIEDGLQHGNVAHFVAAKHRERAAALDARARNARAPRARC